ncbi:SRSF protein kinase 3-like [Nematolebias whitei]|uniref:SRSF protein kinase 3-like n=1 Tax=Nematolebias whitei TaxID=451745 RepID=UPI0018983790|nr:SRSF protein kinase 3-like [Nematolebias whitei]
MQRSSCSAPTAARQLRMSKGGAPDHLQLHRTDSQDSEDPGEYCYGGYHPVQVGDTFNTRYQVVSKLGWGVFSTVWLCTDLKSARRVAVKVLKSGAGFTQAGQDELALLRCASALAGRHHSSRRIVQLLDEFKLVGVNGVHTCLVLELLGPDLRSWRLCFGKLGLPLPWVKQILTQVLQGLDYLHRLCKIIHTDIKPENILLSVELQSHNTPAGGSSVLSLPAGMEANTKDSAGCVMNRRRVCGQSLPSWQPKARNQLTHHALTEEKTNLTPVDWKEVEEAEGHCRHNPPSST